jgi:hypothetical protein
VNDGNPTFPGLNNRPSPQSHGPRHLHPHVEKANTPNVCIQPSQLRACTQILSKGRCENDPHNSCSPFESVRNKFTEPACKKITIVKAAIVCTDRYSGMPLHSSSTYSERALPTTVLQKVERGRETCAGRSYRLRVPETGPNWKVLFPE